jgi:hypothetical protein
MNRRVALLGVSLCACAAMMSCDDFFNSLFEDPCDAAKKHLCEKLPGQGCSTSTMGSAVAKLKTDCGDSVAASYIATAEPACRAGTLVCGAPGCGPSKTITYSGTAEADGRSAHLDLTFSGTTVSGKLVADPVCSGSVRLTRTEIFIRNATLSGGSWEATGASIQGSWDGADYDCNGAKMVDYPTSGDVTISISGNSVYLQRIAGAGRYVFPAQGLVYTPQPCVSDAGSSGGCPGPSIADAGPNPVDMGATLTLTGSGFGATQGSSQVLFGTTPATYVAAWSDGSIQVGVPQLGSEGMVSVAVKVSCKAYDGLQVYYGGCVSGDTRVSLAGGASKRIDQMTPGEKILSIDPESKLVRPALVKKVLVHRGASYPLNTLRLSSGQTLEVTSNHPVLTKERKWVTVEELQPGDVVYTLDPTSRRAAKERVVSIVRDESQVEVVYNLVTTAGNYFANELLIHNKCLARGSLVDTPEGQRPVDSLRAGQMVFGEVAGVRVPTRVTHAYSKRTVAPSLPGKRLSPNLAVTANHQLWEGERYVEAGAASQNPDVAIEGPVYDVQTEAGNYFADGFRLRASGD